MLKYFQTFLRRDQTMFNQTEWGAFLPINYQYLINMSVADSQSQTAVISLIAGKVFNMLQGGCLLKFWRFIKWIQISNRTLMLYADDVLLFMSDSSRSGPCLHRFRSQGEQTLSLPAHGPCTAFHPGAAERPGSNSFLNH